MEMFLCQPFDVKKHGVHRCEHQSFGYLCLFRFKDADEFWSNSDFCSAEFLMQNQLQLEIGKVGYVGVEEICVVLSLHTFWIGVFQRMWKQRFAKRKQKIQNLKKLSGFWKRQLSPY